MNINIDIDGLNGKLGYRGGIYRPRYLIPGYVTTERLIDARSAG